MPCYFRHLKDIFNEAGIEVTSSNCGQIDRAIHQVIGVNYKDCPATWRNLKQQVIGDEQKRREFIVKLTNTVK